MGLDVGCGYNWFLGGSRLNHLSLLNLAFNFKYRTVMTGGHSGICRRANWMDRPLVEKYQAVPAGMPANRPNSS